MLFQTLLPQELHRAASYAAQHPHTFCATIIDQITLKNRKPGIGPAIIPSGVRVFSSIMA
jgi:hypothetical protein